MTLDEKITSLANVFHIIHADPSKDPRGLSAITAYAKNLGCSKSMISTAQNRGAESGFTLTPVGLFSEKVANLEAIILAAILD